MNIRRKAQKAMKIGDYYFYKENPSRNDNLKGIASYERAISFKSERMSYSENILYALSKLHFYSGSHEKSLRTINTCLDYSGGYLKALELKIEILEGMGKKEEGKKAETLYEIEFNKYKSQPLNLDQFYGKK